MVVRRDDRHQRSGGRHGVGLDELLAGGNRRDRFVGERYDEILGVARAHHALDDLGVEVGLIDVGASLEKLVHRVDPLLDNRIGNVREDGGGALPPNLDLLAGDLQELHDLDQSAQNLGLDLGVPVVDVLLVRLGVRDYLVVDFAGGLDRVVRECAVLHDLDHHEILVQPAANLYVGRLLLTLRLDRDLRRRLVRRAILKLRRDIGPDGLLGPVVDKLVDGLVGVPVRLELLGGDVDIFVHHDERRHDLRGHPVAVLRVDLHYHQAGHAPVVDDAAAEKLLHHGQGSQLSPESLRRVDAAVPWLEGEHRQHVVHFLEQLEREPEELPGVAMDEPE